MNLLALKFTRLSPPGQERELCLERAEGSISSLPYHVGGGTELECYVRGLCASVHAIIYVLV